MGNSDNPQIKVLRHFTDREILRHMPNFAVATSSNDSLEVRSILD